MSDPKIREVFIARKRAADADILVGIDWRDGPCPAEHYEAIPDKPSRRELDLLHFWFDPRRYSDAQAATILLDALLDECAKAMEALKAMKGGLK